MNVNRVVVSGNLTRDPDLRQFPSGGSVTKLRLAVNDRRKNSATGDWEDFPNYFDVSVFGKQGENCNNWLSKGRPVIVDGKLRWREWEQDGQKRQAVEIVADNVQVLGGRDDDGGRRTATTSDMPADVSGLETATAGNSDDSDIPF